MKTHNQVPIVWYLKPIGATAVILFLYWFLVLAGESGAAIRLSNSEEVDLTTEVLASVYVSKPASNDVILRIAEIGRAHEVRHMVIFGPESSWAPLGRDTFEILVDKYINLKELVFSDCYNLKPADIGKLAEHPMLVSVSFHDCGGIDKDIATLLPNIKSVVVE